MEKIKTFSEAERIYAEGSNYVTLDGIKVPKSRCCGYCSFQDHPGFVTEKDKRQHNCLGKNCEHYLPKLKKEKTAKKIKKINDEGLAESLNEAIKSFEGMKIIRAERTFSGEYNCYYAAISTYDEKEVEKKIEKEKGIKVNLKKLDYNFENAAEIIFKGK